MKSRIEYPFVRITEIEIRNLKNVACGKIRFCGENQIMNQGNTIGIYGQNGSGKTAVVDAMVLLKALLSGRKLHWDTGDYIRRGSDSMNIRYQFYISNEEIVSKVDYEVEIFKESTGRFLISREILSPRILKDGKWSARLPIFHYEAKSLKPLFLPKYRFESYTKKVEDLIQLKMGQEFSSYYNEEKGRSEITSFLFSRKAQAVFRKSVVMENHLYHITKALQYFAIHDLEIIENSQFGQIDLNSGYLPIQVDIQSEHENRTKAVKIDITKTNVVDTQDFEWLKYTVEQINLVLETLVPGVGLGIYNLENRLTQDGKEGVSFELTTNRNDQRIPLRCESAGIKKIISISSSLAACYNRSSCCLIIDELDSGIYEYLLGELLLAVKERAKGQIMFTSHNLRPLEVLDQSSLIFTTANENNRYIKMSKIRGIPNKRLSYLRSIALGGEKEELYCSTNIFEIEMALRRAGKVQADDKKDHTFPR